ncbi:MAG: TrkA family potassium uptake protein [bacterium]|nr:TrkA family potassium uptake protein [bacterium]
MKVAVIGLGSFGTNLVKVLSQKNDIEIVAIDNDENKVNDVKDLVTQPITMDATTKENLISAGIEDVDIAVVSSGPSLEPSILTVHNLKEIGVPKIYAKAQSEDHETILHMVGAAEVLYPEIDEAEKLGNQITTPKLIDYIPLHSGFVIQEIAPPDVFIGKTLLEIDIRKKYGITVLAIKSIIPDATIINPGADLIIKESDILIVFGETEDIEDLHKRTKPRD